MMYKKVMTLLAYLLHWDRHRKSNGNATAKCEKDEIQTTAPTAPAVPGACALKADCTKDVHHELRRLLFAQFDFRFNVLTEQVEFRKKEEKDFRLLDRRMLNTIVIDVREKGVNCWDKDAERLLRSNYVKNYHPFYSYMESLPQWDGKDRITALAQRVDEDPVWLHGFRRWLLALTAQWMGKGGRCANTLTPMLISGKQGMGKSTFCRLLMPPELRAYYLDKFDVTGQANMEIKLAQFGLINLDEFDRYSDKAMATLKNLVQLKSMAVKKSYAQYFRQLGRIASFIGTSNQMELLNDPSGSRRFLCVEVKHPIDCSPIAHAQLYAQLKSLVNKGERVWMNAEEEGVLQEHNLAFCRLRPEEEVFHQLFRMPQEQEEGTLMGAAEIHQCLCKAYPAAMRGISVIQLGRLLTSCGLKRIRTKTGNKYRVMRKGENKMIEEVGT